MSCIITLVPLAIALHASIAGSAVGILTAESLDTSRTDLPAVDTIFLDPQLLTATLTRHGLHVQQNAENDFTVATESGVLRYFRRNANQPFRLEVHGIKHMDELLRDLDELENEYRHNVQTFTYHKVLESLAEHGMNIESDAVLDDDSILLTLSV